MDSYREHPGDFDLPAAAADSTTERVLPEIGGDERRMHVRAYNYWVSLLNGRDYPSIEDLEPGDIADFAPHSVLLDFTAGRENPATQYIGAAIRRECGIESDIHSIADVPSRSLLSRLTDHYMQIIANRAPIGFEAEFVNQREVAICYRGILMPFSSDGETIDFIYGVINWKQSVAEVEQPEIPVLPEVPFVEDGVTAPVPVPIENREQADEFEPAAGGEDLGSADFQDNPEVPEPAAQPVVHFSWEDGPLHDPDTGEPAEIAVEPDAGLADRLWAARETADQVKAADARSRVALYRALSMAYDFALAAETEPEEYSELLEESGMKAQARAPMTPIVKLVFGIDYDKTRLTEFAAALFYARRQGIEAGSFLKFVEGQIGGLKALVAAERQARRPEPRPDTRGEKARARLRTATPLSLDDVRSDAEFTLVLARRSIAGGVEPVAVVDDEAMVERAIRRATA